MKRILSIFFLLGQFLVLQAKPQNLYDQLCEVNQEWLKNREIAESMGFLKMPIIENEQELLVFHIQTLENIFRSKPTSNLNSTQQTNRKRHLEVLGEYWRRRDCPRNYYLPYRNPVFIDHEGRYCAVAYLMQKDGKQAFCKAVQKNSNFIYIRQIQSIEFSQWQQNSGLSLDELAWIQPGYDPQVKLEMISKLGTERKPILLDSLQAIQIYNPYYDRKDMFGFQRIFWGMKMEGRQEIKKFAYPYKPNWEKLQNTAGGLTALTVYLGELYVATDTLKVLNDTVYTHHSALYKWDKKGNWEKIRDLENQATIYTFFVTEGKLFAGGGYTEPYQENEPYYTHSYLLSFNGKSWKKIDQEYGGIIFGLIFKNKKRYLGTAVNGMAGNLPAPIRSTEESASESRK